MLDLLKRATSQRFKVPLFSVSLELLWDTWQLAFSLNLSAMNISRSFSFAGKRAFGTYKGKATLSLLIGNCLTDFLFSNLNWHTEKKLQFKVNTKLGKGHKIKHYWGWMKCFRSSSFFYTISVYLCETFVTAGICMLTRFWKLHSLPLLREMWHIFSKGLPHHRVTLTLVAVETEEFSQKQNSLII